MVSVIVPVYNAEKYLHRCINSILNQSYGNLELILVDDGSPDNSGTICDEYAEKDQRIHVIHQKNAGVSAARNAGIEWVQKNSDSKWITFVDSDDWIHKEFVLTLVKSAEAAGAQIAACPIRFTETFCEDAPMNNAAADCMDPEQAMVKYPITGTSCCSKLVDKELLKELRFPLGIRYEDASIAHIMTLSANCVAMCWEPMYYYYSNPDSFTRVCWTEGRLVAFEVHRQRLAYFQENGYANAYGKEYALYIEDLIQSLQSLMYLKSEDVKYEQYFALVREELRTVLKEAQTNCGMKLRKENMWAYFFALHTDILWKTAKILQKVYHKLKA